jgi:acetoin utilization deacetylase AcuC-like enzyme
MITVYSESHLLRRAKTELFGGELISPHESAVRAQYVLERIKASALGEVIGPRSFGLEPIRRVHDAGYLDFLAHVWDEWSAAGYRGEAIPTCWPARRMAQKIPNHIDGKLGYYSAAAETSICAGTWTAALGAVDVALTAAARVLGGEVGAFALCRPPGHHAARDFYCGYCFLNNAAIVSQWLRDQGAARIAVLDVDFHHGNGTQDIFYARDDVLFVSIHGDPREAYPHFLGYADEMGEGAGVGFNHNYPLPRGAAFDMWGAALRDGLRKITEFAPDFLVVSLGVDTFERDPISFFKLTAEDFSTYGAMIGALKIPTLFLLEGGYAVAEIGINVVNVLSAFERTAQNRRNSP